MKYFTSTSLYFCLIVCVSAAPSNEVRNETETLGLEGDRSGRDGLADNGKGSQGLVDNDPGKNGLVNHGPGSNTLVDNVPGQDGQVNHSPGNDGVVDNSTGRYKTEDNDTESHGAVNLDPINNVTGENEPVYGGKENGTEGNGAVDMVTGENGVKDPEVENSKSSVSKLGNIANVASDLFNGGLMGLFKKEYNTDNIALFAIGMETEIDDHPYQAFLLIFDGEDYYQCGGSIINEYYIVTAAHCIQDMKRVNIRIGSTHSDTGGLEFETTNFTYHPLYNSTTFDYDVGLVRTQRPMELQRSRARSVELVEAGFEGSPGETVMVSGWGHTKENGTNSRTLNVAEVDIVSRSRCREQLPGTEITDRMFCAGLEDGSQDACQGDSGGPAVLALDGRLAGATSFGLGCARRQTPGVYTHLGNREIREFIANVTGV